jgi:hypothetical protein
MQDSISRIQFMGERLAAARSSLGEALEALASSEGLSDEVEGALDTIAEGAALLNSGQLRSDGIGRNTYGLAFEIELTKPLTGSLAKAAAELLAVDVAQYLKECDWGYGSARIESVYAPQRQFEFGDFHSEDSVAVREP